MITFGITLFGSAIFGAMPGPLSTEIYARGAMTPLELRTAASVLETKAGASTAASATAEGYWLRITKAAEALAEDATTAADTIEGYMVRTAKALELMAGTSGAEENSSYEGHLKRIVDALEAKAGEATGGMLEDRFIVGAQLAALP